MSDTITMAITNCNNISNCSVQIEKNKLNIKYAINGTGKSTIAKAIKLSSSNEDLSELTPFSLISKKTKDIQPSVTNNPFCNVVVFNEDYLKQYVYQKTDLLKNTFEVMLCSDEYYKIKEKIDNQLADVKLIARDKPNVKKIQDITNSLCKILSTNKGNTTLSRKNKGAKSLLDEKKSALFNPPDELSSFKPFIEDEQSVAWASWKLKGISLFGEKGICPYCANEETEKNKSDTALFKESFDEESINFANQLKEYLEGIREFVDDRKMGQLLKSLNSSSDRNTLEMQLVKLRSEAEYLTKRLFVLSTFNGYSIDQDNMNDFEKIFSDMQIEENVLDFFNTDIFYSEIRPLNEQIKKVLTMIGELKGEVAIFQAYLRNTVKEKEKDINEFLMAAGFNYTLEILIDGNDSAHAVLKYKVEDNLLQDVSNPDKHLSWGEKNAFALLLFMYDAISKNADLIILDDPISSFDSNKKYAIINRLFKTGNKSNSLYQKTVLMLTHDLEPVIDYVQVGGKLSGDSIYASYLTNLSGNITEQEIKKNRDMLSMVVLLKEISCDNDTSMPIRIGCLRKYIEHTVKEPKENSKSYNILSSLIHGRKDASYDTDGKELLSADDLKLGQKEISEFIPDFDYKTLLDDFSEQNLISLFDSESNNFFKLLILRAYIEKNTLARERIKKYNDVLRKYTDETYHIENDYLYTLDVRKYNIVPQQYSEAANDFMKKEKELCETKN